jgi:Ca-activated chloride channel family protein
VVRGEEPITKLPVPAKSEGPDLALLERLAQLGGGRPFVAADAEALESVFRSIDALERSPVRGTIRTRYDERYAPWVALALMALALDRLVCAGRLRRLP